MGTDVLKNNDGPVGMCARYLPESALEYRKCLYSDIVKKVQPDTAAI
jgi:hypothetical protein